MAPRSRRIVVGCVLTLFTFAGVAWFVAGSLLAPTSRPAGRPPAGWPVVSITFPSASGSTIAAWYIPADDSRATVILVHPMYGSRRSMLGRARLLWEAGYSIVMPDLQAHGESLGQHITLGLLEGHDVRAAVAWTRDERPADRIGIVGWSLGGAAAVMASPLGIDALALEAVYPTLTEAVANRIAIRLGPLARLLAPALTCQLPMRLGVSATDLRPIESIARVDCPVLIAGGDLDRHTTLTETRRLFAAAKPPRELVVFQGAAHADLLAHDPERYEREVLGFLTAHLLRPRLSTDDGAGPAGPRPGDPRLAPSAPTKR